MSNIFLTGGTGFVGTHVARALEAHQVRMLIRSPKARTGEGVEPVVGDVTDASSLNGAIDGCDVVVHLVGIIEESKGATFDSVIRQGTEHVVNEAKRAGVRLFVHMSALGALDDPNLPYMHAKYRSEKVVKESGLPYTIFRPSVIFGPGDGFINALAGVVRKFPIIPVVGDGRTPFQPVAVSDVATAFAEVVNNPDLAWNQTIELGGSDELTYEEMIDLIAQELEKKKLKAHVPVSLMKLVVATSAPLPRVLRPPVTPEQLKMLSLDNRADPAPLQRLIGREPLSLRGNIGYIRATKGSEGGGSKFVP